MIKKSSILVAVILCYLSSGVVAKLTGSLTEEDIARRLSPNGKVEVAGIDPNKSKKKKTLGGPDKIYKKYCGVCHDSGQAKAPIMGDQSDWAKRVDKGLEMLSKNAWEGINNMPPKGNCIKCTHEDIENTVKYMLDSL